MSRLRSIAISIVLTTSILSGIAATNTDNDADHYTPVLNKRMDIRDCRQKGFDPMRLACPTCDLLPVTVQETCQSCCQSYLATKRRTNPYQSAVLVQSTWNQQQQQPNPYPSELDMLLEDKDEWERILQEKGGNTRLQIITRNIQPTMNPSSERDLWSLLIRRQPPVEVLLFDETLSTTGTLSYDTLKEKAVEIISLQGLSKDDIKDLLMTLLP